MNELALLRELLIIIIVSVGVVQVVRYLRIPAVVGFLVAGMLLGPGGLALVPERETVKILAEFGVALLLFTIGLKFSLSEMLRLRRWVFGAGVAQVILTVALGFGAARLLGMAPALSLLAGCLLALSSTAIVLKLQDERGVTETVAGRFSLSVLILQDLAIVPLLLLVPLLSSGGGHWGAAIWGLAKSLGLIVLILLASRLIVPRLLHFTVGTRNPETFVLTIFAIAMGTAYLSGAAGLSLALGAFLAGIVISDTVYAHHVAAQLLPLRDALSSLFFISIGMLVQPVAWGGMMGALAGLTLGLILIKAIVIIGVALLFGLGWRNAIIAGLSLAQVGELSFLLSRAGADHGLLDEAQLQLFLSVAVLSMVFTPALMAAGAALASLIGPLAVAGRRVGLASVETGTEAEQHLVFQDHAILVGYGVTGRNIACVLGKLGVQCLVVELNPRTVRELRAAEVPVLYGDACLEMTLRQAGVETARTLIIAIADPVAVRCITATARHMNPNVHIIARTRFVAQVDSLLELGANDVVPEELGAALELVGLTMKAYGVGAQEIEQERAAIRLADAGVLCDYKPPHLWKQ